MTKKHSTAADTTAAVDQFMAQLEHPFSAEIQALRKLILASGPDVQEGIKWNAPSYRSTEYFATTNLRAKGGIGIVLHLGAKVRNETVVIADPAHLLTWLGTDRATLQFADLADIDSKAAAFRAILKQWIAHV